MAWTAIPEWLRLQSSLVLVDVLVRQRQLVFDALSAQFSPSQPYCISTSALTLVRNKTANRGFDSVSNPDDGVGMPESISNDPLRRPAREECPSATPPGLRTMVVEAIHQVNAQFVELLCVQSGARCAPFPLPDSLRERFAKLTDDARDRIARCGTLLVDLELADPNRWRIASEGLAAADLLGAADASGVADGSPGILGGSSSWVLPREAFLIAHTAMLVAWSVLHLAPSEAGVLLGISPETAEVIASMQMRELSQAAQRFPEYVGLRWAYMSDAWWSLLDFANDPTRFRWVPMRCLQLSWSQHACRG